MSSIILELQRDSLNRDIHISDLLRKALVVAKKLQNEDFEDWIYLELKGYPNLDAVPSYRVLKGEPVAYSEIYGWRKVSLHNLDTELAESLSTMRFDYPISRFESDLQNKEPSFVVTYDTKAELMLIKALTIPATPGVLIWRSKFEAIIDTVRNIVLDWSLKLEQEGILGDGLHFTPEEKNIASSLTVNIQNYYNQKSDLQIQQITTEDFTMGDNYKIGQAGAVGPNAYSREINFNQIWNEMSSSIDIAKLADELNKLRQEMKKEAVEPEHDIAVSDIARAEQAAKLGDGVKALGYLKSAGKFALDTATKIGSGLAADVIKKSMES